MIPPLTLLTHRNHVCMASFSLKLLSLTICPHPTDILLSILRLCYELGSNGVNPALEKQNQVDSEFEARSVYKESSRALFGKQKQKENPVSENQEKKKRLPHIAIWGRRCAFRTVPFNSVSESCQEGDLFASWHFTSTPRVAWVRAQTQDDE